MKVIAATDNMVVVDLEQNKMPIGIYCTIHTENGFYSPTILRVFPEYIEVDTVGFDKYGNMRARRKRKKVWFRDMLIMNEALYKINHPTEKKK